MYKRPSSSPSVTTVAVVTVATESEHESSPTTPTAATRLTTEAAAAAAAPPPTRLCPPPPPQLPTTPPEATTGRTVKWRLGDYEPGQPLFRHDYREMSSALSSRSIQSGSIVPPSHTAAASSRRQFGYTPRVRDINTASATHGEQTNNTATHRAA